MNKISIRDAIKARTSEFPSTTVQPVAFDDGIPRDDFSDMWLEAHMWGELCKFHALEQLLFHSADSVDVLKPDTIRGICELLSDVHDSIYNGVDRWCRLNLLRGSWVPSKATITLADLQRFTADQVKKAILANAEDHAVVDVSVQELISHIEDCFHADLPEAPGRDEIESAAEFASGLLKAARENGSYPA